MLRFMQGMPKTQGNTMNQNDILTRLRDIASLRGDMSGKVIPVACWEAADEIERLRIELENVRAENQRLSQIAKY
jgi:hypothetical protein